MIRRYRFVVLTIVLATAPAVTTAACDSGDTTSAPSSTSTSTSTREPASTTGAPATNGPSSTSAGAGSAEVGDRGDWTDERYDFGIIASAEEVDGHVVIRFDREQLYSENGDLQSGAQFTEEPIVTGNTDAPMVNDNPTLRRYVLAPEAEVLRVRIPQPCADGANEDLETTWDRLSPADLTAGATEVSTPDRVDVFNQVTLTFDPTGLVTRVRLGAGC